MEQRRRFESMYRRQGPAVRTFVRRRVDPDIADDLVADVFLAAWRRFDEQPVDELTWLLAIARGLLANQRRGQARRSALHERLIGSSPRDIVAPDLLTAGASPVLEALSSLSEHDQEILLLVAWDGLDRGQAARVLGITGAQFALRLHRARGRLQRALDAQPAAGHPSPCSTSESRG